MSLIAFSMSTATTRPEATMALNIREPTTEHWLPNESCVVGNEPIGDPK
jgi:hypothetical protein